MSQGNPFMQQAPSGTTGGRINPGAAPGINSEKQPKISLPRGGGAIQGIGEKFQANPATGTGSLSIPLALSPGRSGFTPQLALSYDSGAGNSPFGLGWGLGIPSVSRKTQKGIPQYKDGQESDIFLLSGAEDLAPVLNEDGTRYERTEGNFTVCRYRPRIEGLFARIERWAHRESGHIFWKSTTRENITAIIHNDELAVWPCRPDPFSSFRSGFDIRTHRICRRVLMFHHFKELGNEPCLVRSAELKYKENPIAAKLISVAHFSYRKKEDGHYERAGMPETQFAYSEPEPDFTVRTVDPEYMDNLPQGIDGGRYRWQDLYGEGIGGILAQAPQAWYYKPNLGPGFDEEGRECVQFGPLQKVAEQPAGANLFHPEQQLVDLGGDGQQNLVIQSPALSGYYEIDNEGRWKNFRPFAANPNVDWGGPDLRLIDLTGDGHADILITEDHCFVWYRSLAEEGFGPAERVSRALDEESGPRIAFSDAAQSIYLADSAAPYFFPFNVCCVQPECRGDFRVDPCITGPYTSVGARLTLLSNRMHYKSGLAGDYRYQGIEDPNFRHELAGIQSMATSSAQNDSGLFELSFRDERYLPFEGAGAVSSWRLELPEAFRQFDYQTISDVIIHMNYTARDGGDGFKGKVNAYIREETDKWLATLERTGSGMVRLFSMREDFPEAWDGLVTGPGYHSEIKVSHRHFPYFMRGRKIEIKKIALFFEPQQKGEDIEGWIRQTKVSGFPEDVTNNIVVNPAFEGADMQMILYELNASIAETEYWTAPLKIRL